MKMTWTAPAGDQYKVVLESKQYRLYVNKQLQPFTVKESVSIEDASRMLANMYRERQDAE